MTSFTGRVARHILVIKATKKAAKEFKKEIEKAGLDTLKTLADAGISIVGTYLNGCSPQEKKKHKQELTALLQMGVTPDMLLDEIARQLPELAPILESKAGYKKSEIEQLEAFLKEGG